MLRPPHRLSLLVLPLLALAAGGALASEARAQRAGLAPAGLTAYRPRHGAGYAPFARTAVPEAQEENVRLGPGIRVNGAGELDPFGEDDLVELVVGHAPRGATLVLERDDPGLHLWTTPERQVGTELAFSGNRSGALVFGGATRLTLWVEWTGAAGAQPGLGLLAPEPGLVLDRLRFHAFQGAVAALGGEGQVPSLPVDPNHGTFLVATELYELGWDVWMHDEDDVSANGSGKVYDELVNAIQHRGVTRLAIFGYSHGGGSTYDLCERLDTFRAGIGTFTIAYTSYVDGIQNDSDIDLDMELRHPPSSLFHVNHYQHGTLADFFLDGGPVPASTPPPTGLDVETVPWGAGATHYLVDDYTEVRDTMLANLEPRVAR